MANWLRSFGTIYHGLQGRWRMGGLNPAVNDDEAVTKAQLDEAIAGGGGSAFPFTGDALITGTLNIDFTDTLDFYSGDYGSISNLYTGEVEGDFIGFVGRKEVAEGVNLQFVNGTFHTDEFEDDGSLSFHERSVWVDGGEDFQAFGIDFLGVGGEDIIDVFKQESIYFEDENGGHAIVLENYGTDYRFSSSHPEGTVALETGQSQVGFRVSSYLSDDAEPFYTFQDNNSEVVLAMIADGNLVSETILSRDYADDAAAEAAGVPEGGFYHTAGVLKIRLPLP